MTASRRLSLRREANGARAQYANHTPIAPIWASMIVACVWRHTSTRPRCAPSACGGKAIALAAGKTRGGSEPGRLLHVTPEEVKMIRRMKREGERVPAIAVPRDSHGRRCTRGCVLPPEPGSLAAVSPAAHRKRADGGAGANHTGGGLPGASRPTPGTNGRNRPDAGNRIHGACRLLHHGSTCACGRCTALLDVERASAGAPRRPFPHPPLERDAIIRVPDHEHARRDRGTRRKDSRRGRARRAAAVTAGPSRPRLPRPDSGKPHDRQHGPGVPQ
jgi:hypothetical protein